MDPVEPRWRKSSHSMGNGGNCVEVAVTGGVVLVRDSKDPGGPALRFGRKQWQAFVGAVGEAEAGAPHRPSAVGGVAHSTARP